MFARRLLEIRLERAEEYRRESAVRATVLAFATEPGPFDVVGALKLKPSVLVLSKDDPTAGETFESASTTRPLTLVLQAIRRTLRRRVSHRPFLLHRTRSLTPLMFQAGSVSVSSASLTPRKARPWPRVS